jgi:hypothetical protein
MKTLILATLVAIPVTSPRAQLRGLQPTVLGTRSLTSMPCSECIATTNGLTVGILYKELLGLGYHATARHWASANESMSLRLGTLELHAPTAGRFKPFFLTGFGRGSIRLSHGYSGHQEDTYVGSRSSAYTVGAGVDIRLYRRLMLSSSLSSPTIRGVQLTHCYTWYSSNGLPTDECTDSKTTFSYTAFTLGIGLR